MSPRRLACLLLASAAVGGCSLTSAEPDPVQVKLDDVDRRVGQVERVVNNQSLVELAQRVESLQNEQRQLRGQLEELENANEALRKQQRDLYADLDSRLAELQARGSGATAGAAPAAGAASAGQAGGANTALPESAQQAYAAAFNALKAGQYPAAIQGFQGFLANHPNGPLSDNAQYWLGEAYYVTRDYERALVAFSRVQQQWPESRKLPDALVKRGFSLFELKRLAEARAALEFVVAQHAGTDAARLAAERLKRIPADAR